MTPCAPAPTPAGPVGLRALAPGKVNLCLLLGPRRDDGRHELVSLVESLSLADELVLEPAGSGGRGDAVVCPGVDGPNLAGAALAAYREASGWAAPAQRLTISKRVPVAAGMGGGSADAAAALRLAAYAHGGGAAGAGRSAGAAAGGGATGAGGGEGRSAGAAAGGGAAGAGGGEGRGGGAAAGGGDQEAAGGGTGAGAPAGADAGEAAPPPADPLLLAIAARLGADVPAQVAPGLALMTGAGERVRRLRALPGHAVLVLPSRDRLSTPDVFAEADRLNLPRPRAELDARLRALESCLAAGGPLGPRLAVNDLEDAARSLCPSIGAALADARAAGARQALVSGSGPTVVGVFTGADASEHASDAAAALAGRHPGATCALPVEAGWAAVRRVC